MKVKNLVLALGIAGLGVLQQVSAASALTWNWAYTTNIGGASGQWESDGTDYDPTGNTTYRLLSITGQRNDEMITGLSGFFGADNLFRWNGTNILVTGNGFSYTTPSNQFNVYGGNFTSPFRENQVLVTSSTLSPAVVPAPVPEPGSTLGLLALGAMGAGTMFKRKQQQKA